MKTCPACHSVYEDAQNFCLNDGSSLVSAPPMPPGPQLPTENLPYDRSSAQTDVMNAAPTVGNRYSPQMPPPPAPYMMPAAAKKSPLPWVLAGAVVVIAAVVIVVLVTRSSTASGVSYDSPDGRFNVTLPPGFDQFKSQKTTRPTPAGDIELTILQTENSRGGCMVGFSDFPEASFEGRTPLKMLEDGRDGALRNIGGTLEKQENINVQGRTGISIYGSGSASGRTFYVRFNFILDKPRAYQVGFLGYERAELDKPDVEAYLKSFRLK